MSNPQPPRAPPRQHPGEQRRHLVVLGVIVAVMVVGGALSAVMARVAPPTSASAVPGAAGQPAEQTAPQGMSTPPGWSCAQRSGYYGTASPENREVFLAVYQHRLTELGLRGARLTGQRPGLSVVTLTGMPNCGADTLAGVFHEPRALAMMCTTMGFERIECHDRSGLNRVFPIDSVCTCTGADPTDCQCHF